MTNYKKLHDRLKAAINQFKSNDLLRMKSEHEYLIKIVKSLHKMHVAVVANEQRQNGSRRPMDFLSKGCRLMLDSMRAQIENSETLLKQIEVVNQRADNFGEKLHYTETLYSENQNGGQNENTKTFNPDICSELVDSHNLNIDNQSYGSLEKPVERQNLDSENQASLTQPKNTNYISRENTSELKSVDQTPKRPSQRQNFDSENQQSFDQTKNIDYIFRENTSKHEISDDKSSQSFVDSAISEKHTVAFQENKNSSVNGKSNDLLMNSALENEDTLKHVDSQYPGKFEECQSDQTENVSIETQFAEPVKKNSSKNPRSFSERTFHAKEDRNNSVEHEYSITESQKELECIYEMQKSHQNSILLTKNEHKDLTTKDTNSQIKDSKKASENTENEHQYSRTSFQIKNARIRGSDPKNSPNSQKDTNPTGKSLEKTSSRKNIILKPISPISIQKNFSGQNKDADLQKHSKKNTKTFNRMYEKDFQNSAFQHRMEGFLVDKNGFLDVQTVDPDQSRFFGIFSPKTLDLCASTQQNSQELTHEYSKVQNVIDFDNSKMRQTQESQENLQEYPNVQNEMSVDHPKLRQIPADQKNLNKYPKVQNEMNSVHSKLRQTQESQDHILEDSKIQNEMHSDRSKLERITESQKFIQNNPNYPKIPNKESSSEKKDSSGDNFEKEANDIDNQRYQETFQNDEKTIQYSLDSILNANKTVSDCLKSEVSNQNQKFFRNTNEETVIRRIMKDLLESPTKMSRYQSFLNESGLGLSIENIIQYLQKSPNKMTRYQSYLNESGLGLSIENIIQDLQKSPTKMSRFQSYLKESGLDLSLQQILNDPNIYNTETESIHDNSPKNNRDSTFKANTKRIKDIPGISNTQLFQNSQLETFQAEPKTDHISDNSKDSAEIYKNELFNQNNSDFSNQSRFPKQEKLDHLTKEEFDINAQNIVLKSDENSLSGVKNENSTLDYTLKEVLSFSEKIIPKETEESVEKTNTSFVPNKKTENHKFSSNEQHKTHEYDHISPVPNIHLHDEMKNNKFMTNQEPTSREYNQVAPETKIDSHDQPCQRNRINHMLQNSDHREFENHLKEKTRQVLEPRGDLYPQPDKYSIKGSSFHDQTVNYDLDCILNRTSTSVGNGSEFLTKKYGHSVLHENSREKFANRELGRISNFGFQDKHSSKENKNSLYEEFCECGRDSEVNFIQNEPCTSSFEYSLQSVVNDALSNQDTVNNGKYSEKTAFQATKSDNKRTLDALCSLMYEKYKSQADISKKTDETMITSFFDSQFHENTEFNTILYTPSFQTKYNPSSDLNVFETDLDRKIVYPKIPLHNLCKRIPPKNFYKTKNQKSNPVSKRTNEVFQEIRNCESETCIKPIATKKVNSTFRHSDMNNNPENRINRWKARKKLLEASNKIQEALASDGLQSNQTSQSALLSNIKNSTDGIIINSSTNDQYSGIPNANSNCFEANLTQNAVNLMAQLSNEKTQNADSTSSFRSNAEKEEFLHFKKAFLNYIKQRSINDNRKPLDAILKNINDEIADFKRLQTFMNKTSLKTDRNRAHIRGRQQMAFDRSKILPGNDNYEKRYSENDNFPINPFVETTRTVKFQTGEKVLVPPNTTSEVHNLTGDPPSTFISERDLSNLRSYNKQVFHEGNSTTQRTGVNTPHDTSNYPLDSLKKSFVDFSANRESDLSGFTFHSTTSFHDDQMNKKITKNYQDSTVLQNAYSLEQQKEKELHDDKYPDEAEKGNSLASQILQKSILEIQNPQNNFTGSKGDSENGKPRYDANYENLSFKGKTQSIQGSEHELSFLSVRSTDNYIADEMNRNFVGRSNQSQNILDSSFNTRNSISNQKTNEANSGEVDPLRTKQSIVQQNTSVDQNSFSIGFQPSIYTASSLELNKIDSQVSLIDKNLLEIAKQKHYHSKRIHAALRKMHSIKLENTEKLLETIEEKVGIRASEEYTKNLIYQQRLRISGLLLDLLKTSTERLLHPSEILYRKNIKKNLQDIQSTLLENKNTLVDSILTDLEGILVQGSLDDDLRFVEKLDGMLKDIDTFETPRFFKISVQLEIAKKYVKDIISLKRKNLVRRYYDSRI